MIDIISINSMIHWGENICFLRKQRNLSQDALATSLSISRVKLNAHENGRTVNPTAADLVAVSDFFELPIDTLLKIKLGTLSETELKAITSAGAGQLAGHDLRVLAITLNPDNEENVEFVPVKAKAGYRAGHRDPEYLAKLPKFSFPDLPKGKTFRMFPTTGDSMLPIPEGSIVLASYVTDWLSIKAGTRCILILRNDMEFVFKKVTIQKNNKLLLVSENGRYKPYEVNITEVLEVWEYNRFISQDIPERGTDLDEIKSMLGEMQRQLELR